jgi:RHS repeat-associated protein
MKIENHKTTYYNIDTQHYPFGMLIPERTYSSNTTDNPTSYLYYENVLDIDCSVDCGTWTKYGTGTFTTCHLAQGYLQIGLYGNLTRGAYTEFDTEDDSTYVMSMYITGYNTLCTWEVSARDAQGNIIASQIVTQNGLLTFEFTATGTKSRIYVRRTASSVTFGSFGVGTLSVDGKFAKNHGVGLAYRYGFQNQEMDNELKGTGNSINYKYRMHDPRIGRFFALDPLAPEYPFYSPYAFSGNRVVDMVEQEGLQPAKPGEEGEIQNAYMTGPNGQGEYDDFNHMWEFSNGTWNNLGVTNDPRLSGAEVPHIIPRSRWGAIQPNNEEPYSQVNPVDFYKYIIIHHSGNTNSPPVNIVQLQHLINGFNDIGYHYAIDLNGNIFQGRPLWKQGAAVSGVDKEGVLNIVVLGDMQDSGFFEFFSSNEKLTPQAYKSLVVLVNYLALKKEIQFVGGHLEIYSNYTQCPGNQIMDIMPDVRKETNTSPPPVKRKGNLIKNIMKYF